jgi:hypothetical protein
MRLHFHADSALQKKKRKKRLYYHFHAPIRA